MEYKTCSIEETIKIGKEIATKLKGGDIVLLHGDLGTGKTTLVKGIASAFGIDEVVSPTFTLMQLYEVISHKSKVKSLVHIDTYRLENEDQLLEIGVEDYLGDPDTVCLIEWPEKIKGLLKNKQTKEIYIRAINENERSIEYYDTPNLTPFEKGKSKTLAMCKKYLGKKVKLIIDQPAQTTYKNTIYEVNYGYVPDTKAPDGDGLDGYFLDTNEPLKEVEGICIGIVHRLEDDDDKLLISNKKLTIEEMKNKVFFKEKYFKHEIIV